MTRQKKEIIKKIDEIERFIRAEEEIGCGFAPAEWFEPLEKKIYGLEEELARLRHYDSVEEMYFDNRGCDTAIEWGYPL